MLPRVVHDNARTKEPPPRLEVDNRSPPRNPNSATRVAREHREKRHGQEQFVRLSPSKTWPSRNPSFARNTFPRGSLRRDERAPHAKLFPSAYAPLRVCPRANPQALSTPLFRHWAQG